MHFNGSVKNNVEMERQALLTLLTLVSAVMQPASYCVIYVGLPLCMKYAPQIKLP